MIRSKSYMRGSSRHRDQTHCAKCDRVVLPGIERVAASRVRYARERAIRRRGAYRGMGCSAHIPQIRRIERNQWLADNRRNRRICSHTTHLHSLSLCRCVGVANNSRSFVTFPAVRLIDDCGWSFREQRLHGVFEIIDFETLPIFFWARGEQPRSVIARFVI